MVRVSTGARLHFGFQNLSLAHERLYGGVGVALDRPRVVVEADPAPSLDCGDDAVAGYAERALDLLEAPGATVRLEEQIPRHVGLGSGTQLALATLLAVARAHDLSVDVREMAPALGRGGRSAVGVAGFGRGGFVVDGGQSTADYTSAPPVAGDWTVPPVLARHALPADWRFVVVVPDVAAGRSGEREDVSMRATVERAAPGLADTALSVLVRRLLPAAATGDRSAFGAAVAALGRLNGAWYAHEQGGVYRPPAGRLVRALSESPAVDGVGQSSWGPAVYALTGTGAVDEVRRAAREALAAADLDGEVVVAGPDNAGATVE